MAPGLGRMVSTEMPDAFAACRGAAPADVAEALDRLRSLGFEVTHAVAPHGMGFAEVTLARGPIVIAVVRDRGQWMCDVSTEDGVSYDLVVYLVARGVVRSEPGLESDATSLPVPGQLPVGVSWSEELPATVTWLVAADRREATAAAWASVKEARLRRWPG